MFGPPAAGKGTVAKYLENKYNPAHLSTGHIFRTEIHSNPDYAEVKKVVESGGLVDDNLTISIVEKFLDSEDISNGVIFDGFPRNVSQAEALCKILEARGMQLDSVLDMEISEDELVKRICGRYSCEDCGASYHTEFNPTKVDGVCDGCGSKNLVRREEDSEEVLKERMKQYHSRTMPLLDYYKEKGILKPIEAAKSIEEVQSQVNSALN